MTEPLWFDKVEILAIHREQLAEHGGLDGLRDEGLLESALMPPQNAFYYEEADLYKMATAYAYGIVKNPPFIDGNKRTAYVACFAFLRLHSLGFKNNHAEKLTMMLGLAAGEISEDDFAAWLRRNC